MSFETIPSLINRQLITAASSLWDLASLGMPQTVSRTRDHSFGDYQSNIAFRLTKIARQAPIDVAEALKSVLEASDLIKQIDVAGKGFLNFWLNDDWIADRLKAQVSDPNHGIPQHGSGKTVVIDYSSPNVAKRMHIGHMRSTIIGHTLDQLHRAAGWKVIADNHIGDWGKQFGMLIVMWKKEHDAEAFETDPIGELERLYVGFAQVATPELEAQAREEVAKLQSGDPVNRDLWQRFITESMREFNTVYHRLGIEFDEILGESAYNDMLPGIVKNLVELGLASQSDGAVIMSFPKKIKPKMLSETVLVIQKSDGAFLYGTTDLATLKFRHDRWSPKKIVYVTDLRQQLHFQQVFHTWDQWRSVDDNLPESATLSHVWFGMLKLPEGAMSTRKGNVIRLVDLLNEAVRRARVVVDEKSPDLLESERIAIAEAVGISAVRYFDLSQNPQSDVIFDWDRMLSLEGNTAPFLMYSFARGKSIQRKGNILNPSVDALAIHDDVTRQLLLKCLETSEIVLAALEQAKPNLLCDHLFALATLFNRFYYSNPVLSEPDVSLREARLAVVEAVLKVLKHGFSIIGLHTLQRM